jgi:hypothetical protein
VESGLCFIKDGPESVEIEDAFEITTEDLPILESGLKIKERVATVFKRYPAATYCIEKMIAGATTSPLLFYVQMAILEEWNRYTEKRLIHPLPIQLKSYIKSITGETPKNKTAIVEAARTLSGYRRRMSSHIADAYFLALLGRDVLAGKHSYKRSINELPLFFGDVLSGNS